MGEAAACFRTPGINSLINSLCSLQGARPRAGKGMEDGEEEVPFQRRAESKERWVQEEHLGCPEGESGIQSLDVMV